MEGYEVKSDASAYPACEYRPALFRFRPHSRLKAGVGSPVIPPLPRCLQTDHSTSIISRQRPQHGHISRTNAAEGLATNASSAHQEPWQEYHAVTQ